jgi:glycosyltransferase involved in cell wall biosynthesis
MNYLILVDNLNIGGIQRLALDQAYEIIDQGHSCEIWIFHEYMGQPDIFQLKESELIESKYLKIRYISGGRLKQLKDAKLNLKGLPLNLIISHSLRGGILVFILRPFLRANFKIVTVIHQLPSLSRFVQRAKRMFYSQFTDSLFIYSLNALRDWNYYRKKYIILWLISCRRLPSLCRNGVYLPRLKVEFNRNNASARIQRLIFLGRVTEWKGLGKFLEICKLEIFRDLNVMIITPEYPTKHLEFFNPQEKDKFEFVVGESVSNVQFKAGDVHLFPVVKNNNYYESISINVLEMAALGICSLVTKGGTQTWPELIEIGIVKEVDWDDTNSLSDKIYAFDLNLNINELSTKRIIELIDIKSNIKCLTSKSQPV